MRTFCILFCLISMTIQAQNPVDLSYYLPNHTSYDKAIPTPESVLGHQVGKWHVTHDKLVQYMETLAAASDRITIEDRGKTFEDRPLLLLTITSPTNHQNIDNIRNNHVALTENGGASLNTSDMPIVVYQGFSIHGNEPSGSNASLLAAYHLAASESQDVKDLLNNTVILFDPSFNPDGLQRFAYWANVNKSKNLNSDPNDREYDEVWPGGRTNHYWFDMNRDWLPVQLPESRARIASFHKWMPNILTDHHEMGTNATFFFQPGIPSRTHPLTPKMNQQLTKEIGDFHAKALDKIGSLYYTEESYDDFYYGKGSTFPDINGSIGILFEQASSRGHIQQTENGLLTFPFTIRNQLTAALSTLEAAKSMRVKILDYQRNFYTNARNEASRQGDKAIAFGSEKDAARTYHLAEILKRHNIKFHEVNQDFTSNGKRFKKGYSYIVPKNQKNTRLLNAMFDVRTTFTDSLFYDVSAWTFSHAFNVDFSDNAPTSNAGNQVTDLKHKVGGANKSNYAYLMEWHEYYTPSTLYHILKKGIRAKVATKKFSINGKQYDYGTILIPVQNQKMNTDKLHSFLNTLGQKTHIQFDGVGTGLTPQGIDLGSRNFAALKFPKIAVLVGEGIRAHDAGEIWHLFDTRFNMKVTKLDTKNISGTDLSKYTTLIVPSSSGLNDFATKKVDEWIKNGGTIIAYRSAVNWLKSKKLLEFETKKVEVPAKNITFEQRGDFRGAQVVGGAIFEAKIDRSHPINFGYTNDKIALFRNNTIFIKADKDSYNNPITYTNNPLLSGYISKPNLDSLAGTVPFKVGRKGRGRVIAFTDNTNFRAFWYGTNKLMMNAIFFSKQM